MLLAFPAVPTGAGQAVAAPGAAAVVVVAAAVVAAHETHEFASGALDSRSIPKKPLDFVVVVVLVDAVV